MNSTRPFRVTVGPRAQTVALAILVTGLVLLGLVIAVFGAAMPLAVSLTDRGVGPRLAAGELHSQWFEGCARLHLPAYSLVSAPIRGAALAAAARAPRVSVDLSSTAALRGYGVDRFRVLLARLRPDVVFGNEAEVELAGDLPGTELVVKRGARGVRIGGTLYAALPTRAIDSTGAGDAFAAGYLIGGVSLGLQAASRAVARMGAMP